MKAEVFTLYFLIRFLINLGAMITLVRFVYYPIHKNRNFNFPFFMLNFIVFLLAFTLEKAGSFGTVSTAFGLLAAFTLLRFRTEQLSMQDMTYLFIIMTLGLINATMRTPYYELVALNVIIVLAAYIVDSNLLMPTHKTKTIEINSLDNVEPENHEKLIAELSRRTGLKIRRIVIEHIDIGKNRMYIKIYY